MTEEQLNEHCDYFVGADDRRDYDRGMALIAEVRKLRRLLGEALDGWDDRNQESGHWTHIEERIAAIRKEAEL